MEKSTVAVIGAGQAGLAMSNCLTGRSIDHVVIERGEVANSWRTERWDSLRLLTPNWMTRLPGHSYRGADPDGYMTAGEVAAFLDGYRSSSAAPVRTNTAVESVRTVDGGFRIDTSQGPLRTRAVVVATGAFSNPRVPSVAAELPPHVRQLTPTEYRNPDRIGDGRVLVVGASASGAQIAQELAASGREVTLAVGEHVRVPRSYRGMDIHWWMDAIGLLDERYENLEDIARARRVPSLQLVGSPEKRDLDLNSLHAEGIRLVGRLAGVSGDSLQFSGSFANVVALADLKLGRLLDSIDDYASARGLDSEIPEPDRPARTAVPAPPTTLRATDFETVVWATGHRAGYPWLEADLLDRKGSIVHDGGVMARPGMYVLGLPFMRRRKSSFLDGVGFDALELGEHLSRHLEAVSVPG